MEYATTIAAVIIGGMIVVSLMTEFFNRNASD
jgi:hypothetical protein